MAETELTAAERAEMDETDRIAEQRKHKHHQRFRRIKRSAYTAIAVTEEKIRCTLPRNDREKILEAAGRFENGTFVLKRTGLDIGLDPEMAAVLNHIRSELIEEVPNPKLQDIIAVDMVVMALRQFYRLNAWLENISLTLEREMFLEEGLAEIHGPDKAERIELRIALLETKIMKMIERVSNQVFRALDRLPSGCRETATKPLIGRADQVNIGSQVLNE